MSYRDILEFGGAFNGTAIPDNVVLANTPAWHQTGTVLDTNGEKGLTIEQALPASGLDFTVVKTEIFGPKGQKIDRRWGVMREDTEVMLGVVGDSWTPMQPIDGFEIVNDLIQQAGSKCWIESAGEIDGGRKIWVMAHIETNLQIAGEKYFSYILFSTGFDGRLSTTSALTDVRVVCANTLSYSLFGKSDETGYIVKVRHTKNAAERIKEAAHLLGLRNKRAEELCVQGEWLVEQKWDEGEFNNFLETLMPIEEEQLSKPAGTMINARRDAVRKIYFDAPNLNPIRGTAWGAFQSVLEFADYGRKFNNLETQTQAQFGMTNVAIKQEAYNLVTAFSMS